MADPTLVAVLTPWTFQPGVVLGLLVSGVWYAAGLRRRRLPSNAAVLPRWRAACYYAGLAVVALALASPIDVFAQLFFFIHMIQHLLLQLVAPPLLLLGRPLVPYLWALPPRRRAPLARLLRPSSPLSAVAGMLARPPIALPLFLLTTWVWHLPPLYDAALEVEAIHALEHALFFGTALLFWWSAIHPSGGRRRLPAVLVPLYLFAASVGVFPVGVLLTFASSPVYPYYAALPRLWGLPALADQEIGGLLMWVGGGVLLSAQALVAFAVFFAADERAAEDLAEAGVPADVTR